MASQQAAIIEEERFEGFPESCWERELHAASPLFEVCARKPTIEGERKIIKNYWEDRAATFGDHTMAPERWAALIQYQVRTAGLGDAKLDVLDAGCGTGAISMAVAAYGHRVTGIDLAQNMVDRACENARAAGVEARFLAGDGCHLPFADESFDLVVNRNVLWGLVEPESALAEWKRVLKPGGMLVYFDSEWYGYLNDEGRDLKRRAYYGKGTSRTYDVLESAVWDLPLTFEKRPNWDVSHLADLGFCGVSAENVSAFVWDEEQRRTFSFAPQFMVKAVKPKTDAAPFC